MKIFFLLVLSLFILSNESYAQKNPSMRSIAVEQLYQYGQAVFHRGDFTEASSVFTKLLAIDPSHEGAIEYAKKLNVKGEHITIPTSIVSLPKVKPAQEIQSQEVKTIKVRSRTAQKNEAIENKVVHQNILISDDKVDLKEDISQANLAIEKLKDQVSQLRSKIAQENVSLPIFESNK